MPYYIVQQLVRVGVGEASELIPMDLKTVGNAPNNQGKPDANGNIPDFIKIPPIIRLYIGNDSWGTPTIMPTFEEMKEMDESDLPKVWTITLNPRTGNFNWHFGLGAAIWKYNDPLTGLPREEKLKPESGSATVMARKLGERIGTDLAKQIVAMMTVHMVNLNGQIKAAKEKKATKAKKVAEAKPVLTGREAEKAAIIARKQAQAQYAA